MGEGAELEVTGGNAIQGRQRISGPVGKIQETEGETREYFYAQFSRPIGSYKTWENGDLSGAAKQAGDNIGIVTDTATTAGEQIEVRVGISYIGTKQARTNLQREIPSWTFDRVKSQTRA